jgi:hypothetical protein
MVDTTIVYTDGTPLLSRAALTGDVTASTGSNSTTIANNAVTNAKAAQMAAHTFKGNNTGSTADALDLTATELTAELNVVTSALKGLAPASGGGTTNFLRADGTWAAPPGGGGGGSITISQATIDFGTTANTPESVTTTIADATVTSSSKILLSMASPAAGRDLDEMEMEDFNCSYGNIVDGVSFDVIVRNSTLGAHGEYLLNYTIG